MNLSFTHQDVTAQNPKSKYRNARQTQKVKSKLRKSETGLFGIAILII